MTHPLDPLAADEIRQAAAIVRRDQAIGDTWRFASIELKEPAKADLPALEAEAQSEAQVSREALVVCWDRADGRAYRAAVSLTGNEVTSWEHLPGQRRVQLGRVAGPLVQRDRVQPQPVLRVGEH